VGSSKEKKEGVVSRKWYSILMPIGLLLRLPVVIPAVKSMFNSSSFSIGPLAFGAWMLGIVITWIAFVCSLIVGKKKEG